MPCIWFTASFLVGLSTSSSGDWIEWANEPPSDIPFERSTDIIGWEYLNVTGFASYGAADTWYPSWGADNRLYSPWTDGSIEWANGSSDCASGGHKNKQNSHNLNLQQNANVQQNPSFKITRTATIFFFLYVFVSVLYDTGGTGWAVIEGDDPMNLTIVNGGCYWSNTAPYEGRYPCASLYYNNTWFFGTYAVDNTKYKSN